MSKVYYESYISDGKEGIAAGLSCGDTGKEYATLSEALNAADQIDLEYKAFIGIMSLYGIPAAAFPAFKVYAEGTKDGAGEAETTRPTFYKIYIEGPEEADGEGPYRDCIGTETDIRRAKMAACDFCALMDRYGARERMRVYVIDEGTGETVFEIPAPEAGGPGAVEG